MLTIAVVVAATALAFAVGVVAARRHGDRRYEAAIRRLDEQIAPISETLRRTVERADQIGARRSGEELSPNVERLLEEIAAHGAPAQAFRRIADEVAPELAGARRLPRAKQPPARDDLTGVRDRSGYEVELEREVARATRTGRPLALVLLDLGELAGARVRAGHSEADGLLQDFAALLLRVTRVTDTVSRRRGEEFGILLPETNAAGADRFHRRLRDEAATTFGGGGKVTFAAGIAEWRPSESVDAFDARARASASRAAVPTLEPRDAPGGHSIDVRRGR